MSKSKKIGGDDWIGKKVETWWGTTSTWEKGKIMEYKYVRDEYKVVYDDEEHWEEVDSLFRFFDEDSEKQKKELLRTREAELAAVSEKLISGNSLENWSKKFIRKVYTFLDRDPDQVLEFLDPDVKFVDQMPQLIRTEAFPLVQKLSSIRDIISDDILYDKVSKILSEEKSFPLVGRRKGHGKPRGRGRPKGTTVQRLAKKKLSEFLDDVDVMNEINQGANSQSRVKVRSGEIRPDIPQEQEEVKEKRKK